MSQHGLPEAAGASSGTGEFDSGHQAGGKVPVHCQLPTMQRNALRKIFNRPDFTPDEVARLGHQRLKRAEGIGCKGLANIIDWLRSLGYELARDVRTLQPRDPATSSKETNKLQKALRVLKSHGYTVLPNDQPEDGGNDCCA